MKTTKLLVAVAVLAILLSGFSSPAVVKADWSKVDQRVLDQIDANGTAKFHVVMAKQADVSGAALLDTKLEKTTYVYNLLTRTAAQSQAPLLNYLQAEGIKFQSFYIYNMIEVTAGHSAVQWLASRPEVARIILPTAAQPEPVTHDIAASGEHTVLLPEAASAVRSRGEAIELNLVRVKADDAWAMGFRGEGMVVASNDTGVEYTHPALVNQYRGNLGGGNFDHNYSWWDAWGGAPSPTPVDYDGHGTHTTGTMAGDDGGANQIGVAPGSRWIACAGMNVECFQFFLAPWDLNHQNPDPSKAPDAINNSWYDPSGYDYRPIIQALNIAGIAVIKSAGNTGPGCSTISNPGYVPEIIATAAFDHRNDLIASFSARGPMSNYGETILKPEVAAPGVNIRSSVPGGGYDGTFSGTSMAAPHSTAMVALIWNAAPCIRGNVPLTKQIMMETAESKIDAQCVPFVDHPNDVWGWGVLDAQAAVQTAIGYCGGMGTLQGTVTDASTSLPVPEVTVKADGVSGFSKSDTSDVAGFYTMDVLSDTYTVSTSVYGYVSAVVNSVVVTTDMTTTLDIILTPLPVYTVSGYVKETGTNLPLVGATLEFTENIPVDPVTTDDTGYYSIEVAEGTWHLLARAASHLSQTLVVNVNSNITADFFLDPLPCVLLVDDDNNAPDNAPYFTAALDNLGYGYNIFETGGGDGPGLDDLLGYKMVIWFSGDAFGGAAGPNAADEGNLATYLDGGGKLFLDSQDYLYDMGLTLFGQNYLGVASYTNDSGDATSIIGLAGDPIGDGLGPFSLTYPSGFSDYGDIVNPATGASTAFKANNNTNKLDVDKDGGDWQTVFFGTSWVALYNNNASNGRTVMQRAVDFLGGCEPHDDPIEGLSAENNSPTPLGETTTFTATVTGGTNIQYDWDFGDGMTGSGAVETHTYAAVGVYTATVTATNNFNSATATTLVTVTDLPIEGLAAQNDSPTLLGGTTTFTATITDGTNVVYTWDFGDGITMTGQVVEHVYQFPGEYAVTVTAANSLGSVSAETVAVIQPFSFYLPLIFK